MSDNLHQDNDSLMEPLDSSIENALESYPVSNKSVESLSRSKKTANAFLLAGGLTALAFQQAPTNEAVRTAITLEAFEETDNKEAAALASGLTTFAIEAGTSTLIAVGLTREGAVNRFVERYKRRKSGKKAIDETLEEQEPEAELSNLRKVTRGLGNTTLALALGPGILVIKKHLTGENETTRDAIKTGVGFSLLGSVVSAGVFGYGITTGKEGAESLTTDTPFENVVDFAVDPKTWAAGIAIGGIAYGVSKLRRKNEAETYQTEYQLSAEETL